MKCIKNNKTGNIERVTDREAYNMVGNTWSYVSKSEWKMVTRKPKVEQTTEETPTEKVKSKKQLRKQKAEA